MISDGIQVNRDPQDFTGTLQACITFPEVFSTRETLSIDCWLFFETKRSKTSVEYRWASPNVGYTELILQDLSVYPGEVTCFPFENVTQTYFAVELQQGWELATFIQTLLPEEKAILFLGVGLYLAALVFTLILGFNSIRILSNNGMKITELSMGGFLLLSVALLCK